MPCASLDSSLDSPLLQPIAEMPQLTPSEVYDANSSQRPFTPRAEGPPTVLRFLIYNLLLFISLFIRSICSHPSA